MGRLTEYLHYFIRAKIKDDPNWSKPQIILSGAEVPGLPPAHPPLLLSPCLQVKRGGVGGAGGRRAGGLSARWQLLLSGCLAGPLPPHPPNTAAAMPPPDRGRG